MRFRIKDFLASTINIPYVHQHMLTQSYYLSLPKFYSTACLPFILYADNRRAVLKL